MIRIWSLVCGMVVICASPAFAQGFGLGVKGGVNIATQEIKGDDGGPSLDPRYGGVVGAFVTLPLLPWVGLQAEGLYSMKGTRFKSQGIEAALHLDYAEIPVLVKVRFAHRYYAAAGPSMAFAMRARTRTSFGGVTEEIDVMDQVKRFDFGVAMGGGVEFGSVVVDGRYTLGLTDIDKDKTDTSKTKNRTISLTAGFRF